MVIKSGINNERLHLLEPFYSRLSIFLSSLTKSLRLLTQDLVHKENIILNISMKDVHDFVENPLTSMNVSLLIVHFGTKFSQLIITFLTLSLAAFTLQASG